MKVTKSIIAVLLCLSAGSAYADCEYYLQVIRKLLIFRIVSMG